MSPSKERFLTFYIDSFLCALSVREVREINRPDFSSTDKQGLQKLRDQEFPELDLRQRMGLPKQILSESARLIVFKHEAGFSVTLVDSIHVVIDLYADQWDALSESELSPFTETSIFKGVATWRGQSVLLIDIQKLSNVQSSRTIA